MNYKLTVFVPLSDFNLTEYVNNQAQLIKQKINIQVEVVDNSDSRMLLYCKKPDRVPCFMIFKNSKFKTYKQIKVNDNDLLSWVTENVS